jgi:hypothetical protein
MQKKSTNNSPKQIQGEKRGLPTHDMSEFDTFSSERNLNYSNCLILVHQKYSQKRPEGNSIPPTSHHQSPGMGGPTAMPAHMSSQSSISQSMMQQAQSKSQSSNNRNSNEPSFSAVLRNLAKQQVDIKDDDMGQTQPNPESKSSGGRVANEKEIDMSRQGSSSRNHPYDARSHTTIRHMSSPEPPEKKVNFKKKLKLFYVTKRPLLDTSTERAGTEPTTAVASESAIRAFNTKWLPTLSTRRATHASSWSVSNRKLFTIRTATAK